jgi:hypothetical protein
VAAIAPHLHDVLANVCRGRVAYICLTREQKRALRDSDGRIALEVLRHLLGARAASGSPGRAPKLFPPARALRRRIVETGVLQNGGSYRQQYRNRPGGSGFRVLLYLLLARVKRADALVRVPKKELDEKRKDADSTT